MPPKQTAPTASDYPVSFLPMSEDTEIQKTRQTSLIDPTIGRMMDSIDKGLEKIAAMQSETMSMQREIGRKQAEIADRKAAAFEKLASRGMTFAFLFLLCACLMISIGMFTGHLSEILEMGAKLLIGVLIFVSGILGYDRFRNHP
jgi:hypothetical protein